MRFIDANVILRYVLDDHAELSPKAKRLIGECCTAFIIYIEICSFNHLH
jgi:predicted nucleic acid-binding protein